MVGAYGACAYSNLGTAAEQASDNDKATTVAKAAYAARAVEGQKQIVEMACQVTALALSGNPPTGWKALGPARRSKMRICLQNKACEDLALRPGSSTLVDLRALAACPVNAMCLAAARRSTNPSLARKQCPLLLHAKAILADKAAVQ
jgi:hypothetical protein